MTKLALTVLAFLPFFASGQVVSDPKKGLGTQVLTAGDGIPVVQISAPSAAGVSRNDYTSFNVDPKGLVFNNSTELTQSQLAGYVQANPNLSCPAKIILNEVTSSQPSRLLGFMEVAGQKADVVVANPNGITCNGCGFVNVGRGTLTTGTPVFGGSGSLDAFRVVGGNISIEGAGMNATNIEEVDLLARSLTVNAEIWANAVFGVTGANEVSYTSLTATPIAGSGALPAFSLDVGGLGSMYAGKISLEGTEAGVGVRQAGSLSSTGEFLLTSGGDITLSGTTSAKSWLDIESQRSISNQGTTLADGGMCLVSGGDTRNTGMLSGLGTVGIYADGRFDNSGGTTIGAGIEIQANEIVNVGKGSTLASSEDMGLYAKSTLNQDGAEILSLGNMSIAGDPDLGKADSVVNASATIDARGDLVIATKKLENRKTAFDYTVELESENVTEVEERPDEETYVDIKTITTTEKAVVTKDSDPANLLAEGNIVIFADDALNDQSVIAAGKTVAVEGTQMANNPTPAKFVTTLIATTTTHCSTESGTCSISMPLYTTPDPITQWVPDSVTYAEASSIARDHRKDLPASGIFTIQTSPDAQYLVETDPRFTNRYNFLSSNELLGELGIDPEMTMKRVGDGFYEQQLVLDQVLGLTGRRFLAGYDDSNAQYDALMDSGARNGKRLGLVIGKEPTREQLAQIDADMVWLVEENVGGYRVLVPKLYLAPGKAEVVSRSGGVVSAGEDVIISLEGGFQNRGTIAGDTQAVVDAGSITNTGRISSGELTSLTATGDIVDVNGRISSKGDVVVSGKNVTMSGTRVNGATSVTVEAIDGNVKLIGQDQDHKTQLSSGGWLDVEAHSLNGDDQSKGNILVADGDLKSKGDMLVKADRNIDVVARYDSTYAGTGDDKNWERHWETESRVSSIRSSGNMLIDAGNDATFHGTNVKASGDMEVVADGKLAILAVKDTKDSSTRKSGKKKWERTDTHDETVKGATFSAGGSAKIGDKERTDLVVVEGSTIEANGEARVTGVDVDMHEAREVHSQKTEKWKKKSSMMGLKKKTVHTIDEVTDDYAVGSVLSAKQAVVDAKNNANVTGSDVVGTEEADVTGANVNIVAAEDRHSESHYKKVTESGLLGGGGVGFTVGKRTEKNTQTLETVTHRASMVGSTEGNVNIYADKEVKIVGSDIVGDKKIGISGESVTIEEARDTQKTTNMTEVKQTGFSVSLQSPTLDLAQSTYESAKRVGEVQDERLAALYGMRAARQGNEMLAGMANGQSPTDGLRLELGMTTSGATSESYTDVSMARGSTVMSNGTIEIVARNGDITSSGTEIAGTDVTLDASRDIILKSAENRMESGSGSSSYSASAGISVGVGKNGGGVGVYGRGSLAESGDKDSTVTHSESTVNASGTLKMTSGRDTTLKGAQVGGETVDLTVGRNLSIESEQDTSTYHGDSKSASVQGSYNIVGGGGDLNASLAMSNTDSTYKSVQEQSGIYAGSGGFNVKVKGNTDLKGGVIASEASPDKNLLDTKTITYSDIENESKYHSESGGVSVGTSGVKPTVGVPARDEKKSTTKSAVAQGTITTTSDTSGLSRDTKNANQAIGNLFDKAKVEEKKELVKVFGEEAYKTVGDIATAQTRPYEEAKFQGDLAEVYKNLKGRTDLSPEDQAFVAQMEAENGFDPASIDQTIANAHSAEAQYQGQYEAWKDGGALKTALHGLVGAAQVSLGGGSALSGAAGAAAPELLSNLTSELPEGTQRWANMVLGATASRMTGGSGLDALAGAGTAGTASEWNLEKHQWMNSVRKQQLAKAKELEAKYEEKNLAEKALDNLKPCGDKCMADAIRSNIAQFDLGFERAKEGQEVFEGRQEKKWFWAELGDPQVLKVDPGMGTFVDYSTGEEFIARNPMALTEGEWGPTQAWRETNYHYLQTFSTSATASGAYVGAKAANYSEQSARDAADFGAAAEGVVFAFGAGGFPGAASQDMALTLSIENGFSWGPINQVQARELLDQVKREQPAIVSDLLGTVETSGGQFVGLEFQIKSQDSLARKLLTTSPAEIKDALRYTKTYAPEEFVDGVNSTLADLQSEGYVVTKFRETFQEGESYKGINTSLVSPKGQVYELQFHTPLSFDVKQNETHALYEQYRVLDPATPEARAIEKQLIDISSKIPTPPNMQDLIRKYPTSRR